MELDGALESVCPVDFAGAEPFAYFDALLKPVLVTDARLDPPGPRIVYVNAGFERLTGWPRARILGRTPRVLLGPRSDRATLQAVRAALGNGHPWAGEAVTYGRDGRAFTATWSIAPVRDAAGTVVRHIALLEDVTEHARARDTKVHLSWLVDRLLATASEGIVMTDEELRITRLGGGAEQIFGWSEAAARGQPVDILMPARSRPRHARHVAAFAAADRGPQFNGTRTEVVGLRRDGTEFPAVTAIARLPGPHRAGYIAIVRDLSVHRDQERRLAESERRFRSLFHLFYQFVCLLAPDGRLLEVNQTALDFIGARDAEVRGRPFLDTPWFNGEPEARRQVRELIEGARRGRLGQDRVTVGAPDGSGPRTFDISFRPIPGADGALQFILGEAHDITEIARQQAELERTAARMRTAQRIGRIASWDYEVVQDCLHIDGHAQALFGLEPYGTRLDLETFRGLLHPDDRPAVNAAFARTLATGVDYEAEYRLTVPGEPERVVYALGEVQRDARGRIVGMLGVAQDVTERHRAQQELVAARDAAEAANEAKSRFLSTMSHELRTPLNAINGFAELLAREELGPMGVPKYRAYAGHIQASGEHLLDLIDTVLDVTRLEHGRIELDERRVDARSLLATTGRLASAHAATAARRLTLDPGPAVALWGDSRLLRQALLNLIGNALKFAPDDSPVTVTAGPSDDGGWAVRIADRGPGIPQEQLARVQLPFVQGDSSLARRHEGSGLGLYLAKSFLELHDGRLSLSCPADGGTVARAWLPPARVVR
jgi:PAS domain S-box-containing protein